MSLVMQMRIRSPLSRLRMLTHASNLAPTQWPRVVDHGPVSPGFDTSNRPQHHRPADSDTHADRLGLEIIFEHLAAHLAAPARLLVAAKGHRRVEDVVAVDPDRTGAQLIGD